MEKRDLKFTILISNMQRKKKHKHHNPNKKLIKKLIKKTNF
jgi:hypothetical protein